MLSTLFILYCIYYMNTQTVHVTYSRTRVLNRCHVLLHVVQSCFLFKIKYTVRGEIVQ